MSNNRRRHSASHSPQKRRLDLVATARYPELTRQYLQSMIMQGRLLVDGVAQTKPGTLVAEDVPLELRQDEQQYVSRAGYKLERALDHFGIVLAGKVALDAGISTGGFSQCMLQRGIARIYGVDVGYGQVHEAVSKDPRLVLMERTNLRYLEPLPELLDIVTLDLSFISVTKVLPVITQLLKLGGELVVLIKPQFEAGKEKVGRGGIITDPAVHQEVIETLTAALVAAGFTAKGCIESPILGGSGNKEFLGYFVKQ